MTDVDEKLVSSDVSQKRRIIRVAKEFQVSVETLVEFLQESGFKIKNHMSPVTPEMYEKIAEEYGKEIGSGEIDSDDIDFQTKAEQRREKEQERLDFIRKEIQEITDSKVISLDEVQERAAREAEEARQQAEERREIAEKAKKKDELQREKRKQEKKSAGAEKVDEETAERQRKQKAKKSRRLEMLLDVTAAPAPLERIEETREQTRRGTKAKGEDKPEPAKASGAAESGVAKADGETAVEETGQESAETPAAEAPSTGDDAAKSAEPEKKTKKRKKKDKKRRVSDEDVTAAIRKTIASMDDRGKTRRRKRTADDEEGLEEELETNVIRVSEFISVAELANEMDVEVNEVIKQCLNMGVLVSINQRLDMDTITMLADEFGFDVEEEEMYGQEMIDEQDEEDVDPEKLTPRPPVVTIMGHVDHGKTSLLDHIRSSNIIAGEVGGITQHIGAYVVDVDGKKVSFLDTPGHEAFTAMRARGAQVTDIVVLVVAADDKVMPQTIEAINHARAANVPIIVAINKIDKDGANPEAIKKQLSENNILVEDWGGKYPSVELSAKTGKNIEQLLELLTIQAEILELTADHDRLARGVIIESELDKGRGPVATVLVQQGTLRTGDPIIAGHISGKVRAMFDERGRPVSQAPPSTPVQVLGFDDIPLSGDFLHVLKSERVAKDISVKRQQLKREQDFRMSGPLSLDEFSKRIGDRGLKELKLIVKADVAGSVEALGDSLMRLGNEEVAVKVIHKAVGTITENDVLLASASQAVIIGFHIRPNSKAREVAEKELVEIRTYEIIYDAIEDVKKALEGMLTPEEKEEILGVAEVREVFRIPKVGTIAGSYVQNGKFGRNDQVRVIREGVAIYDGVVASLKRFKDDVREVQNGYECGIGVQDFNDIKVGDTLEGYQIHETKAKLED